MRGCDVPECTVMLFFLMVIQVQAAWERNYDMFRTDYPKGAFCTAIAGACASDHNPENAFFQNPAALAFGNEEHELYYDADFNPHDEIEPGMQTSDQVGGLIAMAGLGYFWKRFGLGVSYVLRQSTVTSPSSALVDDQGGLHSLKAQSAGYTSLITVPMGVRIHENWSVGLSFVGLYYQETLAITTPDGQKLASPVSSGFPSMGLTVGTIYQPLQSLRLGAWMRLPIALAINQGFSYTYAGNSINYSEQLTMWQPYLSGVGASMLLSRHQTLFVDLYFIGTTQYGFLRTLDFFDDTVLGRELLEKGHLMVIEPHLAYKIEIGRGAVSFGGYYESARVGGEKNHIHAAFGVSYHFSFAEIQGAFDVAEDFRSFQVSMRKF